MASKNDVLNGLNQFGIMRMIDRESRLYEWLTRANVPVGPFRSAFTPFAPPVNEPSLELTDRMKLRMRNVRRLTNAVTDRFGRVWGYSDGLQYCVGLTMATVKRANDDQEFYRANDDQEFYRGRDLTN